ncbi:MAG: O-antigen ligase family protein [Clostridia bacterium]|nr:O-antigen ligase family protein [Clostridia bacterium]
MISESVILSFFVRLYHLAMDSCIIRAVSAVLDFIGRSFRGSVLGKIFCREKSVDAYAEGSVFYGALDRLWQGILRFFGRIYEKIRQLNTESVNRKIFDSAVMGSYVLHMETLLAVAVFVIFAVPHDFWNNLYASVLAAGLFLVYFLCILSGKKELGRSVKGIWLPFLFFIFITLYSVIGSLDVGDSIRVAVFFVTAFLLCILVSGTCKNEESIRKLLSFMALAVFVTAAYGIVQRVLGVEADASLTDLELNANMPGRVFSTLGNPNNFAEFLMLFTPFTFAWMLTEKHAVKKGFGFLAVILAVLALLLTYSRSGWLAFLVAVLVFIALYNKKLLPIVILVGILCIPLLPESILNRILTIGNLEDSSSSYRVDIWTGSIAMLRDGYWLYGTGLGAGAFTTVYPGYAIGESRVAPHTHMQFMEMLAEMGILGLLAILWFSVSLVRRTAVWAGKAKGSLRAVLCAAAASMAGITAIGFVEYTWFYPRVMLAFFICAGIAMAAVKLAKEQK